MKRGRAVFRSRTVLSEKEYLARLSDAIEQQFFPNLKRMQKQVASSNGNAEAEDETSEETEYAAPRLGDLETSNNPEAKHKLFALAGLPIDYSDLPRQQSEGAQDCSESSRVEENMDDRTNGASEKLTLSEFLASYTNESKMSFAKLQEKMKAKHYKKLIGMCPKNVQELNPNLEQLFLMNSAGNDTFKKKRKAGKNQYLLENKAGNGAAGMKPPAPAKPRQSAPPRKSARGGKASSSRSSNIRYNAIGFQKVDEQFEAMKSSEQSNAPLYDVDPTDSSVGEYSVILSSRRSRDGRDCDSLDSVNTNNKQQSHLCRWPGSKSSVSSSMASSVSRVSQLSAAGRALAIKMLREKQKIRPQKKGF